MKLATSILGGLILAGCSQGGQDAVPSMAHVNAIERKLADDPCIGELTRWERTYRFAKPHGLSAYTAYSDPKVIEFHLRQAGTVAIEPGRRIIRRNALDDWPDGSYVRSIDGTFDVTKSALRLGPCPPDPRRR